MRLAVTVLGSSGVYATSERACSGYLLELAGKRIWMDAGAGTWRNLLHHVDYKELDGVLLSHRHPDHTTDVFMAYHARFFGDSGPLSPIPLWAPAETIEHLTSFYDDSKEAFDLHEVTDGSTIEIGDSRLRFFKMAHPPETLGTRIESDGAVLAYSADTGSEADFEGLAGDADVFICEATAQNVDPEWGGHLSAAQAAEIAARTGVTRLLLTHLPPGRNHRLSLEEANARAGAVRVELAFDGLRVELEK